MRKVVIHHKIKWDIIIYSKIQKRIFKILNKFIFVKIHIRVLARNYEPKLFMYWVQILMKTVYKFHKN